MPESVVWKELKNNGDSKSVIFTANSIKNEKISISYEIKNNDYIINSSLFLNENFRDQKNIKFSWRNKLVHQESNFKNEKNQSRINYYSINDGFDYTSATSTNTDELQVDNKLSWISHKQQFFNFVAEEWPGVPNIPA